MVLVFRSVFPCLFSLRKRIVYCTAVEMIRITFTCDISCAYQKAWWRWYTKRLGLAQDCWQRSPSINLNWPKIPNASCAGTKSSPCQFHGACRPVLTCFLAFLELLFAPDSPALRCSLSFVGIGFQETKIVCLLPRGREKLELFISCHVVERRVPMDLRDDIFVNVLISFK